MTTRRPLSAFVAISVLIVTAMIQGGPAQASNPIKRVTNTVTDQYIVTLQGVSPSGVASVAEELAVKNRGRILFTYTEALTGFAIKTDPVGALALTTDPRVSLVEEDGYVEAIATQSPATWGLDRIDQRDLPLSNSYTYNATGSGVKAYIIDTGVRFSHTQFGGRATSGYDAVDGGSADDCNGHGTHVAGTVGGSTYGVAKSVSLIGVRVLDCQGSGTNSGVIAGVDWVTGNHLAGQPAVANMSLGGGANSSLDTAVNNSINDGVTYAIAAGNGDIFGNALDACTQSPARVAAGITVGATNSSDAKASWSNYGTCLDIFAPGVSVTSAWYSSDTATNTISGTSMAAPHVAGVAALYLQGTPSASPSTVTSAITGNATLNKVTSPGSGSPNRLLYMGFIGGGGGNASPTANFTHSCSGLTCSFTDTSTDSDGTISSWSWNFGDGTTSTTRNPYKTYSASGTYNVQLTVTDNGGATGTTTKSVSVSSGGDPDPGALTLSNGVAKSESIGGTGSEKFYKIEVPAGKSNLTVVLDGPACSWWSCPADLDLYDRYGARPTATLYTCRPYESDSDETCSHTNPSSGWWYIRIYNYSGGSTSFTIKATYS